MKTSMRGRLAIGARILLVAAMAATLVGCGDDATGPVEVSVSGNAFSFAPPGFPGWGRIEGASVWVLEAPEHRTTTVDDGYFRIDGLPAGMEATLVLEAEGYPRTHTKTFSLPETDVDLVTFQVPNDGLYDGLAALAETELDPTKCSMATTVTVLGKSLYDPGAHGEAGAIVTIDPPVPAANGPIYFNEDVLPDRSYTESSADGGVAFVNLEPGDYTLTATKPGVKIRSVKMRCRASVLVNASPPYGLQVYE